MRTGFLTRFAAAVVLTLAGARLVAGQTQPAQPAQPAPPAPAAPQAQPPAVTKIAVIDIDRVAAQSDAGKALFDELKKDNDSLTQEKNKREQEIRELTIKMNSQLLAPEARETLRKDVERRTTDAERWLQDKQKEFQDKQQRLEDEFQKKLAPVVESLAKELSIGLIFRATQGLTFVLDPTLDITPSVIAKLNAATAAAKAEPPKAAPKP